jgi:hypothetical protein
MRNDRTIPSVCQRCRVAFLARPGRGKFCSTACYHAAKRESSPCANRVPRTCAVCGTVRMVKPSVIADGKGQYCSKACRAVGIRTHGETAGGGKHSSEYRAWSSIKTRCLNPADPHYPDYGGRGITICDRWRYDFAAFLADMGRKPSPRLSIDRIDNDGNYEPGNCRWATTKQQAMNKRPRRR